MLEHVFDTVHELALCGYVQLIDQVFECVVTAHAHRTHRAPPCDRSPSAAHYCKQTLVHSAVPHYDEDMINTSSKSRRAQLAVGCVLVASSVAMVVTACVLLTPHHQHQSAPVVSCALGANVQHADTRVCSASGHYFDRATGVELTAHEAHAMGLPVLAHPVTTPDITIAQCGSAPAYTYAGLCHDLDGNVYSTLDGHELTTVEVQSIVAAQ